MKTRTFVCIALLIVGLAGSLFAYDFGVTIDNNTEYWSKEGEGFLQEDTGHLWFSTYLGESWLFNASLEGTLSSDSPTFYADVETLSLKGTFPHLENGNSLFAIEIGRFFHKEFSSYVFAHRMDGIRMDFGYSWSNLQIAVGYTGLLNKYYTSLVMSRLDAMDDIDDDILFAPQRLIGTLSWNIPELFARQNLTLSVVVNEDLRHLFEDVIEEGKETFDPTSGGLVETQYFGVGLDGPLTRVLHYDVFFYLGTGRTLTFGPDSQSNTLESYQYKDIRSVLTGFSLRYYLEEFFQSVAGLKFLYATGDKDAASYLEGNQKGDLTMFLPVSGKTLGTAFNPKSSNLMATEVSFSLKPFSGLKGSLVESLQTGVILTPFFKASKGAMSEGEVDPSSSAGYVGTDIAATANLRPFSDLGLGIAVGLFLPDSNAFLPGNDDTLVYGQFVFSFAF